MGNKLVDRKVLEPQIVLRKGIDYFTLPDRDYGRNKSAVPFFAIDDACTTTGTSI